MWPNISRLLSGTHSPSDNPPDGEYDDTLVLEGLPESAWRAISAEVANLASEGPRTADAADKWLREGMKK
jgi:hypothetical protein